MDKDKIGEVLSSGLGNIEKAVITIQDKRGIEKKEEKSSSQTVAMKFTGLDTKKYGEAEIKRYIVQFNPNFLKLDAVGQGKANITDASKKPPLYRGKAHKKMNLTVKLIFDCTFNQDAFHGDKFSLGPTSVARGITNAVVHKKDTFTVRTQVEGFQAALRNRNTRAVTFTWGSLSYKGILGNFQATYTMFSSSGEPIRAEAELGICIDERVNAAERESTFAWMKGGASAVKTEQKFGSLLNVQF